MSTVKKELVHSLDKRKLSWEGKITNIQSKILEHLARYKFLTIPHLLLCDIGTKDYQYTWRQTSSLRDRRKPFVHCTDYRGIDDENGRRASFYSLNKRGKETLFQELDYPVEEIKMPKRGKTISSARYWHRFDQIRYEILLDKWTEKNNLQIPFFDRDFDYSGNNRKGGNLFANTRIDLGNDKYFIPDGAYKIKAPDGAEVFHLLEYERGDKTRKAINKIHKHAEAMTFRCTHRKFHLDESKSYRVVFLFENEALKNLVLEWAKRDEALSLVSKYFICKSIETIEQDNFFDTWQDLKGNDVNFY